jgi:hypothetical protein
MSYNFVERITNLNSAWIHSVFIKKWVLSLDYKNWFLNKTERRCESIFRNRYDMCASHLICSITVMFFLFSCMFCANARYIKRRIFTMRNIMHENPRNHMILYSNHMKMHENPRNHMILYSNHMKIHEKHNA